VLLVLLERAVNGILLFYVALLLCFGLLATTIDAVVYVVVVCA
jgi:hypothetical protein